RNRDTDLRGGIRNVSRRTHRTANRNTRRPRNITLVYSRRYRIIVPLMRNYGWWPQGQYRWFPFGLARWGYWCEPASFHRPKLRSWRLRPISQDEARWIAAKIAKLPEPLRKGGKQSCRVMRPAATETVTGLLSRYPSVAPSSPR